MKNFKVICKYGIPVALLIKRKKDKVSRMTVIRWDKVISTVGGLWLGHYLIKNYKIVRREEK